MKLRGGKQGGEGNNNGIQSEENRRKVNVDLIFGHLENGFYLRSQRTLRNGKRRPVSYKLCREGRREKRETDGRYRVHFTRVSKQEKETVLKESHWGGGKDSPCWSSW